MNCSENDCCGASVSENPDRGLNRNIRSVTGREFITSDNPRLSLCEFGDRYVIECDVPGMSIENVSLQLEDHVLTITGQRPVAPGNDNSRVLFNERTASEFARRLQLSRDIDQNSVDAEMSGGVLRVTIAKRAEVLPRQIRIQRNDKRNA